MIIDIPDNLPGEERKRLLVVKPLLFALTKFRTKVEAAKFLGITDRAIRYAVHRHPELKEFIHRGHFYNSLDEEAKVKHMAMQRRFPDER